jgi:hypothetical protein
VDVLTAEHQQVRSLCRELTDAWTPAPRRRQVAEVITAAVARHLSAEEQYLYPAVRAAVTGGAALADQEIAADTAMQRALKELTGTPPEDPRFDGLAAEVAGQLHRHAAAVTAMFPELSEIAGDAELIRLGNRVEIAEEAAPTRPHPGTPATPPWNKIIEPAVGVVDKARDAVTGRQTYVEDLADGPHG